ncbi:MAG: hypothetical protein M1831_002514 [Alyxoria varia]|nr:MAG: hypothetical protein M1831_002514 [Alyxoria varia]
MGSSHSRNANLEDEPSGQSDEFVNTIRQAVQASSAANTEEESPSQQVAGSPAPVPESVVLGAPGLSALGFVNTSKHGADVSSINEGPQNSSADHNDIFVKAAKASAEVSALQQSKDCQSSLSLGGAETRQTFRNQANILAQRRENEGEHQPEVANATEEEAPRSKKRRRTSIGSTLETEAPAYPALPAFPGNAISHQDPIREGQEPPEVMNGVESVSANLHGPASPATRKDNKRKSPSASGIFDLPRGYNSHDHHNQDGDREEAGLSLGQSEKHNDAMTRSKTETVLVDSEDDGNESDMFCSGSDKENEEGGVNLSTNSEDVEMIEAASVDPNASSSKGEPLVVIPMRSSISHPTTTAPNTTTSTAALPREQGPASTSNTGDNDEGYALESTTEPKPKPGNSRTEGAVETRQAAENQQRSGIASTFPAIDSPSVLASANTGPPQEEPKKKTRRGQRSNKHLGQSARVEAKLSGSNAIATVGQQHDNGQQAQQEQYQQHQQHQQTKQNNKMVGQSKSGAGNATNLDEDDERVQILRNRVEFLRHKQNMHLNSRQDAAIDHGSALSSHQTHPPAEHFQTEKQRQDQEQGRRSQAPPPTLVQVRDSQQGLSVSCPSCNTQIPITPVNEGVEQSGNAITKSKKKGRRKRSKKGKKQQQATAQDGFGEKADVIMIDD